MVANRPSNEYRQLGIGDCGHVVGTWPLIERLKERHVICDECTRERLKLTGDETIMWVKLKKMKKDPSAIPRKRAPRKKAPKAATGYQAFLQQEGLW